MPEGHTIHRIARDHNKAFAGQKMLVSSPQGRFSEEAERLNGNKLKRVDCHGKHLFYHWANGTVVHIHLGLYGKFRVHKNPPPEPRGAVRVRMIGNEKAFDLNGPTRCQIQTVDDREKLMARLGPDPLRQDADAEQVWNRIQRSRAAIGTLLLNQSVVAGIGNVYRAEILFINGIHPERKGNELSRVEFDKIWTLTVELLKIGVKYNRIITVTREQTTKPLSRVNARERLQVYKKTRCTKCGKRVKRWELGSRTMYACPSCQK